MTYVTLQLNSSSASSSIRTIHIGGKVFQPEANSAEISGWGARCSHAAPLPPRLECPRCTRFAATRCPRDHRPRMNLLAHRVVAASTGESMLRSVSIAIVALALLPAFASAKEWAQKMFQATSHDFGHVARGAKAEFSFELQNVYEEDIHIADVRTSCGCTVPTITKPTLKTWEKGSIVATLNTRSFVGQRNSTLTVVIDKPFYAEVQLTIAGYIHSDVDFQPGVAALGDIEQGRGGEQTVTVTYRGA